MQVQLCMELQESLKTCCVLLKHAPGVPRILVGNRLHLAFKRQVPTEQARSYAEKNCMTFFEVSPLCNFNVTESFTELSRIVLMRHGMEKIWRPNRGKRTPHSYQVQGLFACLRECMYVLMILILLGRTSWQPTQCCAFCWAFLKHQMPPYLAWWYVLCAILLSSTHLLLLRFPNLGNHQSQLHGQVMPAFRI